MEQCMQGDTIHMMAMFKAPKWQQSMLQHVSSARVDHPAVNLLIKDMDERLLHPGTELVHAELQRQYWMFQG